MDQYPMISRSGRMSRAVYESSAADEAEADAAAAVAVVEMGDLPGGAGSFELAARFSYGMAVDLTAANISGLRCAAEYLEMTEEMEEGNLIFKTEAFLSYVVLSSWRDSIAVLKSCEALSPWAENLQIVRRCSESIAWKACANPRGVRWAYTGAGAGSGGARGARRRSGEVAALAARRARGGTSVAAEGGSRRSRARAGRRCRRRTGGSRTCPCSGSTTSCASSPPSRSKVINTTRLQTMFMLFLSLHFSTISASGISENFQNELLEF